MLVERLQRRDTDEALYLRAAVDNEVPDKIPGAVAYSLNVPAVVVSRAMDTIAVAAVLMRLVAVASDGRITISQLVAVMPQSISSRIGSC